MPKNASQKKAIRARMGATGEPYMEARLNVEAGSSPLAKAAAGSWVIQQRPIDPVDSMPYEWVLHADRSTYGFIDHGYLIGVVRDPDDRTNVELLRVPLTEGDVRSMVGGYPVTIDRFTGGWSTWDHPVESVEIAETEDQRTRLYGGTKDENPGSSDSDRAARRGIADQRRKTPEAGVFISGLALVDGTVVDVEPGGVTSHGLIAEFVTVDVPKATITWEAAVDALAAGSDLSRLVGWQVRVYPSDLGTTTAIDVPIESVLLGYSD